MKKNKITFLFVGIVLILIFWISYYAFFAEEKERKRYVITVIVDDDNSDRWTSLRQGLDRAAMDYNVEISFFSVSDGLYPNEQIALINRELLNGMDAFIINPVSSRGLSASVQAMVDKVPIVLLENDLTGDDLYPCIKPDHYAIGQALGNAASNSLKKGDQVGILLGNPYKESYRQREAGLKDILEDNGITIAWEIENTAIDLEDKLAEKEQKIPVEAIICLGNRESEAAVDYRNASDMEKQIFAVGNTEKLVYYLDKGLIHTLIVPNEFNMGYLAVKTLSERLEYQNAVTGSMVDFISADKDNMYDSDIQKLLFPIVH